jgi:hypothetical protein
LVQNHQIVLSTCAYLCQVPGRGRLLEKTTRKSSPAAPKRGASATMVATPPASSAVPLGELGWQGVQPDDPEVEALRTTLQAEAGIKGLEIVDPHEPGFAERAAAIFRRDGFVLVADVLNQEQLARVRSGCDTVIRGIVEQDPTMTSNRGSHRYSFGSTPAYFDQHDAWAAMIEPEPLHEVLRAIWGSNDFICTSGANNGGCAQLHLSQAALAAARCLPD